MALIDAGDRLEFTPVIVAITPVGHWLQGSAGPKLRLTPPA